MSRSSRSQGFTGKLPTVRLGSSETLQIGQRTLVIGNPYGPGFGLSIGIISGIGRTPPTLDLMAPSVPLLQTTAPINPGDSGLMKMLFHREDRRLLGVHVIGTGVTELIHIGQAVLRLRGGLDYFLITAFNYPTLADATRWPRWMRTTNSRVQTARRCQANAMTIMGRWIDIKRAEGGKRPQPAS